jgi:hypothetical protein
LYEYNLDEDQQPPSTPPPMMPTSMSMSMPMPNSMSIPPKSNSMSMPPMPMPPSNSIGDGLDEALKAHQPKNKAPLLPRSGKFKVTRENIIIFTKTNKIKNKFRL